MFSKHRKHTTGSCEDTQAGALSGTYWPQRQNLEALVDSEFIESPLDELDETSPCLGDVSDIVSHKAGVRYLGP